MPFILLATFVVLNLFIGVIVDSIQTLRARTRKRRCQGGAHGRAKPTAAAHADQEAVIAEIRALRADLAALRAERAGG